MVVLVISLIFSIFYGAIAYVIIQRLALYVYILCCRYKNGDV